MVQRVVDIHIIRRNRTLQSPRLPEVARPFRLAEVLTCEVRAGGVVFAPFARFLCGGCFEEDLLEVGVFEAVA